MQFATKKGSARSQQEGIQEKSFQEIFGSTHVEGPGLVERVQEVPILCNAILIEAWTSTPWRSPLFKQPIGTQMTSKHLRALAK